MKKKMFFFAAVAATLTLGVTSCNNDSDETLDKGVAQQSAIRFAPLIDQTVETRGLAVTSSNYTTQMKSIGVFGFFNAKASGTGVTAGKQYVGTNAYTGIEIAYSNGAWNYVKSTDVGYWPSESAPLDFYAIHPFDVTDVTSCGSTVTPNITSSGETVAFVNEPSSDDTGTDVDLMYACASAQTKSSNATKVPLYFKHALSQLVFKGKLSESTLSVDVKNVEIHNIASSGTFSFANATTTSSSAGAGSWTVGKTYADYVGGEGGQVTSTSTAVDLVADDNAFMLIPQTLTPWTTTDSNPVTISTADSGCQSYLKINCKITSAGAYLVGSDDSYGAVYVPFGAELGKKLEMGKKYTITLNFGVGYNEQGERSASKITYTVTVQDWTNGSASIAL